MRRKIVSLLLILVLLCQIVPLSAGAAFTDVKDAAVSEAASVLSGMGIVDGVGGGRFSPDTVLTRAQFCALVVRMMGMADQVGGNSYKMLFTDAKPGAWFTGFVNLAYSEGLVNGYGNGKFGPNDPATYGQVATIVLRLLGYSAADVGKVWPGDYVNFANDLGLNKGLQLTAGNITRGQAAVVLYNTLLAASKTTGKEYYRSANGTVSCQKAIVLDVSAKNGGASDQLMVCANGAIGYYDQKMKVPADFVGAVGQVLLSSENKVVGFIPTAERWVDVTLDSVKSTSLTAQDGTVYAVDANAVTLVGRNVYAWGQAGYLQAGVCAGKPVRLYYDEKGAVSHVHLLSVAADDTVTQVVKSQRAIILDVDVDNGNASDLLMAYTIGTAGSLEYYGQRTVLDGSNVGCIGDLLLDEENCVVGFSKASEDMKDVTIAEAKITGLVGTDGITYRITGSAVTIVGEDLYTWKETGYLLLDSQPGKTAKLYYDEIGAVTHVYLNQGTATASTVTAVAPAGGSADHLAAELGISGSYRITKNGVAAENGDIAGQDVAYFDSASGTLRVSDYKVTGFIDSAYPGVHGAETITIAGCEIPVMESAWESLENFTLGDSVTLHLTDDGKAAYAAAPKERTMLGILSTDGRTVTLCGSGLKMEAEGHTGSEKLYGGLVSVSDGIDVMRYYEYTPKQQAGVLTLSARTLGSYKLAPSCEIYEHASTTGYNSYACSLSGAEGLPSYDFRDISWTDSLPAASVTAFHLNSAGQVDVLLLRDVTGNCYEYGKLTSYSGAISMGNMNGMSAKNSAVTITNGDYRTESTKYLGGAFTSGYDTYHGIALRSYNANYKIVTATVSLNRKADLNRSCFALEKDEWFCTVDGARIPVSENVQIYLEKSGTWLRGQEALRAVLTMDASMTVHYDRTLTTGAQVRILAVKEQA